MAHLNCISCTRKAEPQLTPSRWFVWFKFNPLPFYTYMCDDCLIEAIHNGVNGYQVSMAELHGDSLLPDGDRALINPNTKLEA